MTVAEVEMEVDRLRTLATHDTEAAAAGAAELRTTVLLEIADGAHDAVALAEAALVTIDEDIGGD